MHGGKSPGNSILKYLYFRIFSNSWQKFSIETSRRDSVSIAKLSEQEIEDRRTLGLITDHSHDEDDSDSEESFEEFDEDDSLSDDDESYSFSGRKSSVDPTHCISSPQGQNHMGINFDSHVNRNRGNGLQQITEEEDDEDMDL